MKLVIHIRRLFAILTVVGLILTPMARPAMAMATGMPAAMDQHTDMAMPSDMPCCPEQMPMSDCAKDCVFMTMCAAQFVCNPMLGAGLVIPLGLAGVFVLGNDRDMAGLIQGPPPRPPKI